MSVPIIPFDPKFGTTLNNNSFVIWPILMRIRTWPMILTFLSFTTFNPFESGFLISWLKRFIASKFLIFRSTYSSLRIYSPLISFPTVSWMCTLILLTLIINFQLLNIILTLSLFLVTHLRILLWPKSHHRIDLLNRSLISIIIERTPWSRIH